MDNTVVMNNRKECRIIWFIENYSYCWHNNGQALTCPEFTVDGLEGTHWTLALYPRGVSGKIGYISFFLNRIKALNGPEVMPLKFELSVLASNGSVLITRKIEYSFRREGGFGLPQVLEMDDIFLRRKATFLCQDRLCLRCIIWKGEGNVQSVTQLSAVTRIGIKHISFLHVVDGFSALTPNEKKTIQIESPTGNELLTSSVYYSNDSCCKGKMIVEITKGDHLLRKCKLSLLDGSGKLIKSSETDNRFDVIGEDIKKLPLPLSRKVILNRKSEYLSDDKLSLLCDCTFSTKLEFKKIEKTLHQLPLVVLNLISNDQSKDVYNSVEKLSACTSALDDLKALCNKPLLADVKLKCKRKSFHAHKVVLCARSPVFKAMLTSDMKEKNMNCIQVSDLENDTVQQLLMFLYSDNLENLCWESAIKLFYAADKYDILKLRVLCSSFLVDNISTSTAVELLILADKHNDSDLRKIVENFILEHEEEVYGSDEWKNLIEINPQLVITTMNLKYKRRKVS